MYILKGKMDLDSTFFSKTLRLNSHDRDFNNTSETNSKFSIEVPPYSQEFSQVVGFQLISATVPNVFYNIGNADKFEYILGGTSYTTTIPEGQYTASTFLTAVEVAVNADVGGTGFSAILDPLTYKVTLTFSGNVSIRASTDNTIFRKLGFGFDDILYSGTNVLISPSVISLQGPDICFIRSPDLSSGSSDFDRPGDKDTICSVILDKPFGSACSYESSDSSSTLQRYRNARGITSINIDIVDRFGKELDIGKMDLNIIGKIYFIL
jgi:hypothetical protein